MCLGAIYWARIKGIYFSLHRTDANDAGFDDSFIYSEFNVPMEERRIPITPLMIENQGRLFKLWNEKQDKIPY